MLARLLLREGPRQGLRSNRYIITIQLLNDGRGVYPTICTRPFEDELRFQACHGIRMRPGGNTRLERYAEDGQPDQKRFNNVIHSLRKGRAEEGRSRSITSTCTAPQPPRVNHRTHETSHTVYTGSLQSDTSARDIALFTVTCSTLKPGERLSHTPIQRILRLPNECGFHLNFQWGKTIRDGADHLTTVEYDTKRMITCSVRAVEQYIAVGTALGWNMTQGYIFPRISRRPNTRTPIRGKTPISAPDMTKVLKVHARNAGERTAFTMHSFRSGGPLTRALVGEDLPTVM